MHVDDFTGMNDGEVGVESVEDGTNHGLIAYEHHVDAVAGGIDRAADDF